MIVLTLTISIVLLLAWAVGLILLPDDEESDDLTAKWICRYLKRQVNHEH